LFYFILKPDYILFTSLQEKLIILIYIFDLLINNGCMGDSELLSSFNKVHESNVREYRVRFWILDILTIIISYFIAYIIRNNYSLGLVYSNNYLYLLLLMIPTFFILIRRSNFTHIPEKLSFGFILFNFFQLCVFGLLIIFFFLFIFKMNDISRGFIFIFFLIYMITLSLLQLYRSQKYRILLKHKKN